VQTFEMPGLISKGLRVLEPRIREVGLVLEASANLEIWEAVSEPVEADGSVLEILDASSQSAPHRFYRLREVE
jgi:hypothetical protein